MTTVAYKDGVLAADTQVTDSDTRIANITKIARSRSGWVGGICGGAEMASLFLPWIREGCDPDNVPTVPSGCDVLVVSPQRRMYFVQSRTLILARTPFVSLGSGSRIALGAMAAGATAEQAVRIACKYDVNTGGKVQVLKQ